MEQISNREEQIFLAALELGPDCDRGEFLNRACGEDGTLKIRVQDLLAFHQRGDDILDETSGGLFAPSPVEVDSVVVGTQVGPYKLLQEIGAGGMGVVFMAEQQHPVRRKVAVKVIKLGMDTRNVIARFEAERQALAMMDHPNITKVFDAGITPTGRPYFVMELVTGLAITDYCDREKLPLEDRIKLFHQVCVGIKHAHQKGIIHRDLKPSNIMVTHYDGVPVPKIIDFGIAKAIDQTLTEKTLFTSYGNMIGTPEYMSPEQAEMSGQDIDTRADVYALGVLMYELLTGTTPFYHWKKKGVHKICEAICHEEPELASTRINNLADTVKEVSRNRGTDVRSLRRFLRGDLDWILSKCMSKDRNQRYETAADLARDIERYLNGQTVEAVGPNLRYRAGKYLRKHRTAMTLASIVLVTLMSATVISTVFAYQALQAQKLASHRLQEVDLLRKQAETERDRARAAELRLQQLERQSRIEASTARAIEKFNRENPEERISVFYPQRNVEQELELPTWQSAFPTAGSAQNVIVVQRMEKSLDPSVARIAGTDSSDSAPAARIIDPSRNQLKALQTQTYQILIGDGGTMKVTSNGADVAQLDLDMLDLKDAKRQLVVIRDHEGGTDTKKFLKILADEQRELFGSNDDVLANTLIEIGNVSLADKDWSVAENNLRESRDILKRRANHDDRMAKVELLLSQALLNQDKTAAAKETLANGVVHLEMLHEVPEELAQVIEDLKQQLKEKNLKLHELHGNQNLLRWNFKSSHDDEGEKQQHQQEFELEIKDHK